MKNIKVEVIFLNSKLLWPRSLGEEWQEISQHWHEFKVIAGEYLPGSYLLYEGKAVGGLKLSGMRDMASKRKVLDTLRAEGYEPWIHEKSPL